jgi:hypothetical protein
MAATSNCSSRNARYAWRKQNPSQTATAGPVPASTASPSEDTISPEYSGCRTHRYGPRSARALACASTDTLRPSDRSDQTAQAVPPATRASPAHCRAPPGTAERSSGNANGTHIAVTAAACAVTDLLVALAGPRRR